MSFNNINFNMKFGILLSLCIYLVSGQLLNGDDCEYNKGKCILLKDCPSLMKAFRNGVYPETCGFQQKQPLVCCDVSVDRISVTKCKNYSTKSIVISGRVLSMPKEFPHMASLGYKSKYNIVFLCGGSLISEQFILTAAHCLTSQQYGPVQIVRLGEINIGLYCGIKRYIPHPSYRSSSVYNDIALIELEEKIQFNDFIKPICLYNNPEIPPNLELILTGWGLTKYGSNKSDTLQKASLDLFSNEECNNTYNTGILNNSQFCAGGKNSIRDSCQGDSGGPLQTKLHEEDMYRIVGITSFRKACETPNIPGVYTKVSFYVDWIESVVWPNN